MRSHSGASHPPETVFYNAGDRVRYESRPGEWREVVISLVTDNPPHGQRLTFADKNSSTSVPASHCELVQRAHYADPGVPMITLDDKLVAFIEDAADYLSGDCVASMKMHTPAKLAALMRSRLDEVRGAIVAPDLAELGEPAPQVGPRIGGRSGGMKL